MSAAPGARGGPNQEAALAAALRLASGPACILCIDSDGTDGPTDAAGGLVDDLTCAEDADAQPDSGETLAHQAIGKALARHAAYEALATASDLVLTGPTGTNVNDLKIALRPAAGLQGRPA